MSNYTLDSLYNLYCSSIENNNYKTIKLQGPNVISNNNTFDLLTEAETETDSILEKINDHFENWLTYKFANSINDDRYKMIINEVHDINDDIEVSNIKELWNEINIGENTL